MEPKKSSSPEEDKIDSMRLRSKLYVHIRCRSIVRHENCASLTPCLCSAPGSRKYHTDSRRCHFSRRCAASSRYSDQRSWIHRPVDLQCRPDDQRWQPRCQTKADGRVVDPRDPRLLFQLPTAGSVAKLPRDQRRLCLHHHHGFPGIARPGQQASRSLGTN